MQAGYTIIHEKGIQPFMTFVENGEREFLQASDFIQYYDLIFKMCIQAEPHNWSEPMYERYTKSIATYLDEVARPRMELPSFGAEFLSEWTNRWKKHKLIVQGMSRLFMYLDRFYTDNKENVFPLKEQGFRLYRSRLYTPFSEQARKYILDEIDRERDDEPIQRHLLKCAVEVFDEIGQFTTRVATEKLNAYIDDLETHLIARACVFYKQRARKWLEADSCPAYLIKVEKMLDQEKSRVDDYLNRHTLEPLQKACFEHMLAGGVQQELLKKQTGFTHLLKTDSKEDLQRIYRLYSSFDAKALEPIGKMLQAYVSSLGSDVVSAAAKGDAGNGGNHALVQSLIDLHDRFNTVIRECFGDAPVFQRALKTAFEEFTNRDQRVSKLLAKYVDDVLKKGTKLNVKDIDSTLENVVFLYGYIQEKDYFERDYQTHLAKRLLLGLCESQHNEKQMIAKLSRECGYQWTSKLEGMFKDCQNSKERMAEFKKFFPCEEKTGVQLDVNVCTTGYWPSTTFPPAEVPDELRVCCDKYKQFYLNKHSGHKIDWHMDQVGSITFAFLNHHFLAFAYKHLHILLSSFLS
jgi:cullin 1